MLHDTPIEAPYGWTHCLTIPQALLGANAGTRAADLFLAEAIVGANASGSVAIAVDAVSEPAAYFAEPGDRRRVEPGDDLTSLLATAEQDGEAVPVVDTWALRSQW